MHTDTVNYDHKNKPLEFPESLYIPEFFDPGPETHNLVVESCFPTESLLSKEFDL